MPPRPKYTKEDIINAAFELARADGYDAIMAREVAAKLGTSTSPIFTAFSGMDGLKKEVRNKVIAYYENFGSKADSNTPAFMRFCTQMIGFAKAEPQLFKLLFTHSQDPDDENSGDLPILGSAAKECRNILTRDYNLKEDDADFLFRQFWIYTFGLCVLIVNGSFNKSGAVINRLLSDEFKAQYVLIKSGNR